MKFSVPDMSCGHCAAAIEKSLRAKDANAMIDFALEARQIVVTSALDQAAILKALKDAGYAANPA